jgi:hypothetical protein
VTVYRAIEQVAIAELDGHVTSILLMRCPPDIALLNERFNSTILYYMRFPRDFTRNPAIRDRHTIWRGDEKRGYCGLCEAV